MTPEDLQQIKRWAMMVKAEQVWIDVGDLLELIELAEKEMARAG